MPAKYHGDKYSETLLKGSSDMASLSLRSLLTLFLAFGFTPAALGAGSSGDSGSSGYSYTAEPSESNDMRASKAAIERKDFEAALISLERERSANPQNADAWNLTGFSLRKIGQYDGSEKAYIKALTLDPKHTQAMEYMGELYLTIGQPEKANALLERLNGLCSFNCHDRDLLAKAIAAYKAQ